MKVYVITKEKPFGEEVYVGITATKKMAEIILREKYPYMKECGTVDGVTSYKDGNPVKYLLFIREEEV